MTRAALLASLLLACSRDPGPAPTLVRREPPPPPAAAGPPSSPRTCLQQPVGSEAAVRCWVEWLASPALAGRAPGSPGGETARAGLVAAFTDLSLEPGGDDDTFLQALPTGANVLALIPGKDPAREDEVVVVGAHYDHLGTRGGVVYPGADDNASGVAALVEVARRLAAERPARSVLIAAFDAEEPPAYRTAAMGSQRWVDRPTIVRDRVVAMIALDLLGGDLWPGAASPVYVMGRETLTAAAPAPDLARAPTLAEAMHLRLVEDLPSGRQAFSDHGAFFAVGIPTLFLSTGRSPHYHRPTDVPASLDYAKLAAATTILEAHVRWLADLPQRPAWRADPPVTAGDAAAVLRLVVRGSGPGGTPELPAPAVAADRASLEPLAARDPATPLTAAEARAVIAASLRVQCLLRPDDEVPPAACAAAAP